MGSKPKEAQLRITQRIVTSRIRKIGREEQVIVLVARAIQRIRQLNINHNSAQCLPAMHLCRSLGTKYNHIVRRIFRQRQQHQLFSSMETLRNGSKFCRLLSCKAFRRKLRTQNLIFSKLTLIIPFRHNILLRRRHHHHRSLIRELDRLLFYTYISNFRTLDLQLTIPLICLLFPRP